jgi:hypothetical protein
MVATRDAVLGAPPGSRAGRDDETADRLLRWAGRIELWAGIAVVAACCVYIFIQLQPKLLFLDTTTAGGDTGAHVWYPAYLRDHLLPSFRLSGWSPDYYAGFPAGQFYFPLPALLTVALDVFIPYNVAFKLVTALGPVLLPIGAYVFGKEIRAPKPAPALFALGATGYLFFKDGGEATMKFDHHIMGGTLTSTLAGEFSFTIALAFALLFLGTFARALDRRGSLWLPALFFAATITSHLVVGIFVVYAGVIIWLVRGPIRNASRAAAIVAVGGLLTAVWTLPLAATLQYTTDMRYEPVNLTLLAAPATGTTGYWDWLFISEHWFLFPLAVVAIVGGIVYRRRATLDLAAILFAAGFTFRSWEGLRDLLGKAPAWNLRLLPFWYLMLYLLAALGAAEIVRLVARFAAWVAYGIEDFRSDRDEMLVEREPVEPRPAEPEQMELLPEDMVVARGEDASQLAARSTMVRAVALALVLALVAAIVLVRVNDTRGYLPYWAKYNYAGYEGGTTADATAKSYPELKAFMDTADQLPPGRLLWEGSGDIGAYGTPLALMLLPYFTDGRITTMEGLYYEASATTPYHFMAAAALMASPSNPVRGLPYRSYTTDFDLGVRYLQDMGVQYFAVTTPAVKAKADANPALTQIATVPDLDGKPPTGWTIYRVENSALVAPLAYQPVAVNDMHADPNWKCENAPRPAAGTHVDEFNAWECNAVPWFNDPNALDRPLTDGGPAQWQHTGQAAARAAAKVPLAPVQVSNVHRTDDSIEFDVSRTGVPVMVRESYYPNWQADGAQGPWRATPDFMVVTPTSRHVTLTFATTSVEWVGRFATLVGIVGLGLLVWWGRRRGRRFTTRPHTPTAISGGGDDLPDETPPTVRFRSAFRARPPG